MKSHPDLLTAETELQAMIAGEQNETGSKQISNLLEKLEEGLS